MHIRILLLLILFAIPVTAQNRLLYPKPEAGRVTLHKDLEYRPGLKYDVHRPAGDAVVPIVIFANVGSAPYMNWPGYIGWGEAVANVGMAAVLYQASAGNGIADFDSLVADLRRRAGDLKIDPTRIVVWSGSSNVTVGLPVVMDKSRDFIRGAVVYYGSGEVAEIRTDLPVLVIRAGLDSSMLNTQIDALLARAIAANAPWTIENYGGGLHAFDILNDNEVTKLLIHRTLSFMKLVTRPEVTNAYVASSQDAAMGAALARGEWKTAINGYREKVAANPGDGESHLRLGLALLGNREFAEALPSFEKAWELGRRGPRDVALPASKAAAGAGDVPKTIHWLNTLLSTPFGPPIADIRVSAEYERVRNDPSFEQLLTGIEQQRAIQEALESKDPSTAIETLKKAKEGRITREPVLLAMAYRLLSRGRSDAAVEVFRIAVRRYPKSSNAWESLSEAYEAKGEKARAVDAARKAIDVLPGDKSLEAAARESLRVGAAERIERLSTKS